MARFIGCGGEAEDEVQCAGDKGRRSGRVKVFGNYNVGEENGAVEIMQAQKSLVGDSMIKSNQVPG